LDSLSNYYGLSNISVPVATDNDGFAALPISSGNTTTTNIGTVNITGAISTDVTFDIVPVSSVTPELVAIPSTDRIPSDGKSYIYVHGRYLDTDKSGKGAETINWRKGRHIYDVFDLARSSNTATPGMDLLAGEVTTSSDGSYYIGPFIAATPYDPGYWFVAVEGSYTQDATPTYAGDVVVWQEYPDHIYGVEEYSGLPRNPVQYNEWWEIPDYATPNRYPLYYDQATPQHATPTDVDEIWSPPKWYAIDRQSQYQLGYLGTDYYEYDYQTAQEKEHPDYKDK
jgi:hypothetical protein